jgi:hypothetical protein
LAEWLERPDTVSSHEDVAFLGLSTYPCFRQRVCKANPVRVLAIDLTVICVALHFGDCGRLSLHLAKTAQLAERCYRAAKQCLWQSEFLERHSLYNLQSIMYIFSPSALPWNIFSNFKALISIMGLYLSHTDGTQTLFALLGAAIKIAQNMGLSSLGREEQDDNHARRNWVGRWTSLVQREVGRRIWWNLVIPSFSSF